MYKHFGSTFDKTKRLEIPEANRSRDVEVVDETKVEANKRVL